MSLLEEVVSEEKFEKSTKAFKKFMYCALCAGVILIGVTTVRSYYSNLSIDKNRKLTEMIMKNDIDEKFLTSTGPNLADHGTSYKDTAFWLGYLNLIKMHLEDVKSGKKKLSDFDIWSVESQKNAHTDKESKIDQKILSDIRHDTNSSLGSEESKKQKILVPLEAMIKSSDDFLSSSAILYMAMLLTDYPKEFSKEYAAKFFANLDLRKVGSAGVLLKALWVKENDPNALSNFIKEQNLMESNAISNSSSNNSIVEGSNFKNPSVQSESILNFLKILNRS